VCIAGKYKTTTGTAACDPCDAVPACAPGSYRSNCGGSSEGTCAGCGGCAAGAYRIECVSLAPGRCTACVPGTHKTTSGSEPCLTCGPGCEAGKHQSGCNSSSGAPQCTDCTTAPGSYCKEGSLYGSSAAGTTCPLGFFCLGGAQDKQLCAAGTYAGAASSTCAVCSPGTFKTSAGSETCVTCGPGCNAGQYQSGCSSSSGAPQCTDCTAAPGSYCQEGSSFGSSAAGTTCPLGFFCLGGTQDKQLCNVEAGRYCPPGSVSARGAVCPAGFWCAGGPKYEIACAGGTYAATEGSESVAACSDCTPGTFSSAGASGCTKCDPGYVASALGAASCDKCEPGKYAASAGSVSCKSCPLGKTSLPGSVSDKDCNLAFCGAGTYSVAAASTVCTSCVAGKFSAAVGATVASTCAECDPGSFSERPGTVSCTACPTGKTSAAGSVSRDGCTVSVVGSSQTSVVLDVVLPYSREAFSQAVQSNFRIGMAAAAKAG